ncbi:hypothetical protein C8J57DRAFT_1311478 [Mycena rebaudengoi]|nr:hypothetical protein C8J57DRAFT_1311478 [Mycena rebaudengoi]
MVPYPAIQCTETAGGYGLWDPPAAAMKTRTSESPVVLSKGSGPQPEFGSTGAYGWVLCPNSTIHLALYLTHVPRSFESKTPASPNPVTIPHKPVSGPTERLHMTPIFLANPSRTAVPSSMPSSDGKIQPRRAGSPWGTVVLTMRFSAVGVQGAVLVWALVTMGEIRLGEEKVWISKSPAVIVKSPAMALGIRDPAST